MAENRKPRGKGPAGVASLEKNDHSKIFGFYALLKMAELDLELTQFLFIQLSSYPS